MQTIIAPTDFAEKSLNAVNYAADMAMDLNAAILVMHVIEASINLNELPDKQSDYEIEAVQKLARLKTKLIKRTNNKVVVHTRLVAGLIETEIIKACDSKNTLAVVTATKGASLKAHFFMESITVHLSRNLKHPVIAVPAKMQYKPIRKILLATDLENLNTLPITAIIKITNAFTAQIDIVHVYNNENKFEVMASRVTELTMYLDSLNPQFHFVRNTNVYDGIIEFAKQNSSDIILSFPKQHKFFHKSQSKQLVFNAPFTVMTIQ